VDNKDVAMAFDLGDIKTENSPEV